MATPKRLKLDIPNIPKGYADAISPEEWDWLKVQHPADYAYAQKQIKAHEAELTAEAESAPKPTEGETPKPSTEKKGG